jgi:ABC-type histidine transport system ATPase subunit
MNNDFEDIRPYTDAEIPAAMERIAESQALPLLASYVCPELPLDDVKKLLQILQKFADGGNTVVVIEHNMDVIKQADYIIDMGPEGGNGGGTVVAQGTPEEISKKRKSYTGQYLKKYVMI